MKKIKGLNKINKCIYIYIYIDNMFIKRDAELGYGSNTCSKGSTPRAELVQSVGMC